ncbi:GNAT family N-acetyltransferase [Bacillus niameyensis]|uniref:GNAT family N-acetyltransferase n=1 Tax=Bacillus niameyensis TaxID=1522308 RepID=UPI000782475C|nr:GNAT family N-acetyltransferase [Bacillus niameyensis]
MGSIHKDECKNKIERLLKFEHAQFLLAKIDGEYVGFIALNWGFSTTKGQPFLRIQDLFVLEEFRRKGAASALIEESIVITKRNNANRLQLNTGTNNIQARKLYESSGFERFENKEIYMLFLS